MNVKQAWLYSFACVLLGIVLGAGGASAYFGFKVIPAYDRALNQTRHELTEKSSQADQWKNAASTAAVVEQQLIQKDGLQANQVTLLNDPSVKGAIIYVGEKAVPLTGNPRWIIPGKIKPMISGPSNGAYYSYFDTGTGQSEGPYLPATPTLRP